MNSVWKIIIIVGIVFTSFDHNSDAHAGSVKIVSVQLSKGLLQGDGGGFYGELLSATIKNTGIPAETRVLPLKRTLDLFFSEKADCIWPVDINLLKKFGYSKTDIVESSLFFKSSQHVFVTGGHPVISDLKQLEGKRVGILNGGSMEKSLSEVSAIIVPLKDQQSKIRMLLNNRLDAFVGWYPDVFVSLNRLQMKPDQLSHDINPNNTVGIKVVCRKSKNTIHFLNALDLSITRLKETFLYNEIMDKYGVPSIPSQK